jgi:hypothetical protein
MEEITRKQPTPEELAKVFPPEMVSDLDGDGVPGTSTYWLSAENGLPTAPSVKLKNSIRANVGAGKKILFHTRLNTTWLNYTSSLRQLLETNGYTVVIHAVDEPIPDLSQYDVLAIINTIGTPLVEYNDRPLLQSERTAIQNFVSSGKGFFYTGDYLSMDLPKYNNVSSLFNVTFALQSLDYRVYAEPDGTIVYYTVASHASGIFDLKSFYPQPYQPIYRRVGWGGYSCFHTPTHDIFKDVNSVLLMGSSYTEPRAFGVAALTTHPIMSRPRDWSTSTPYPVVTALESGTGRAVISCDSNAFANDGFSYATTTGADNQQFALNIFSWLAKASSGPDITSIEIRYVGSPDNLPANIELSSMRDIKEFQAIGFSGTTELGPVSVTWDLLDGDVFANQPLRNGILTELSSNIGKIGVFSTSTGIASSVLNSEAAQFVSFLSGDITLKTTAPNGISKIVAMRLLQPTFSVKVWPVGDTSVPLYDQWENATREVWEKEKILQIESMQLGAKIDDVVAPNPPLNPFPLLIPTAEAFLNGSFGENVSFLNPIMFDEFLNSNYASKGVLPRQPFVLFSHQRDQSAINVYAVDVVRTYSFLLGFDPQGGFAVDSEIPYYNFDDQSLINDAFKSGIAIRNFQTPSPQIRRYFPHEIGHILIRFHDEHKIDGVSVPVPINNVMTGDPSGDGFEVEPMQFIKILNLDKTKPSPAIFITEK